MGRTSALGMFACVVVAGLASCAPGPHREVLSRDELHAAQKVFDEELQSTGQQVMRLILRRMEMEADAKLADPSLPEPSLDLLSISGGGDYGSFGASFLRAWGTLPQDHPMARPKFDIVGGISTGALIAPFAFEGSDEALDVAARTYTEAKPDWVKFRGLFALLPQNASLFDVSKLEKAVRARVSPQLIASVAAESDKNRLLLVGSTDLDLARMRLWNLTEEAERATKEGSWGRFQDILLSSAAIPLAFPARKIDGKVYADGGVIGNVLMGRDPEWVVKLAKTWKERRPDVPMPRVRMWVLVNNKARMDPQFIGTNWMPVAARSVVASTHASTVQAIQQMWLRYRLAAVETGAKSELYWCAIPDDFDVPMADEMFNLKVTSSLSELGARMGADPQGSWRTDAPKGE